LDKLPNLLKRNEETSWQKASASLDASAKIYGYRVDSVHSDTFKFLGGLSRAEKEGDDKNEEGPDGERRDNKKNREGRHDGFSTLERDSRKLDLLKYDLEFEVDPLFKMMTAKFGDSGARGLLLKNLPVDSSIDVLLESKQEPIPENSKNTNNLQINSEKTDEKKDSPPTPNKMIIDEEQSDQDEGKQSETNNSEKDPRSITTDIMSIVDKTLNSFSIQDLKSIEICPNLSYFKRTRELETSLERTFYNDLMHEFDDTVVREHINLDKSHVSDLDNSMNFEDNLDMDNDNMDNMSSLSQRSSHGSHLSAKFDDNLNMNNMLGNLNSTRNEFNKTMGPGMGVSYMEGFSYLKSDDIKEYIHQFGDGNKEIFKNIPQYKNFTKSFNQLDKLNNFGAGNLLGGGPNNNENTNKKRVKKEEMLFEFSEENEVKKLEIFEKESKTKKTLLPREPARKKNKKKVKQYYHYDRSVLFNLFSIQDRLINERKLNEDMLPRENDDAYSQPGDDLPPIEEEKSNFAETFVKIDSEYEKKFGRLYKTFDVRVIKSKIWESISFVTSNVENNDKEVINKNLPQIPEEQIDFKKIIESVSANLSKEVLSNISTPTCFVCLLHLCNEKSKKKNIFKNF
jgi:hypothetical protein